MKAIILAAGTGSRLRPLTDDRPKCLVELKGRALLDYQLHSLRSAGIDDIAIVTGHKAESLAGYNLRSHFNELYESSNMVYSLFCAESELSGDVLICYGDIIYEPRIISRLLDCTEDTCVVVDRGWFDLWKKRMEDPLADAETMKIDRQGFIRELGKKPKGLADIEGQYVGLIKLSDVGSERWKTWHQQLDPHATYDGKDVRNMFMTSFIQNFIDGGNPVKSCVIEHGWLEVDTLADWRVFQELENQLLFDFSVFPESVKSSES